MEGPDHRKVGAEQRLSLPLPWELTLELTLSGNAFLAFRLEGQRQLFVWLLPSGLRAGMLLLTLLGSRLDRGA